MSDPGRQEENSETGIPKTNDVSVKGGGELRSKMLVVPELDHWESFLTVTRFGGRSWTKFSLDWI